MLSGQRVPPDRLLCQREKEEQEKEELDEGRQDYGFSDHSICGLLYVTK